MTAYQSTFSQKRPQLKWKPLLVAAVVAGTIAGTFASCDDDGWDSDAQESSEYWAPGSDSREKVRDDASHQD